MEGGARTRGEGRKERKRRGGFVVVVVVVVVDLTRALMTVELCLAKVSRCIKFGFVSLWTQTPANIFTCKLLTNSPDRLTFL